MPGTMVTRRYMEACFNSQLATRHGWRLTLLSSNLTAAARLDIERRRGLC